MKRLTSKRPIAMAFCATAAAVALTMSSSAAFATPAPGSETSPESILSAVAPEVLGSLAEAKPGSGVVEHSANGVTATVPLDASEDITLGDSSRSIGIGLPFAEEAAAVETQSDGVVAFDNGNESKTATVLNEDGSVQINTIIESPSAPTRYDYELDVPDGAVVTQQEDGSILISDVEGRPLGGIAPAWAKDANGTSVKTWYEVDANRVTQVVAHSSANQYPVVADPRISVLWWGVAVKLTKAETKNLSKYAGTTNNAVSAFCAYVPVKTLGVACGFTVAWKVNSLMEPIRQSAASGKCAQLNFPWGTNIGFWNVTKEKC